MRKRTRARELALQALYQLDVRPDATLEEIEGFLKNDSEEEIVFRFAWDIVQGCHSRKNEIDASVRAVAENWDIRRMAIVDRNIIRLAVYELKYLEDIPPKVSINEAVELAKRFSTAGSGAFVNGILDRIKRDMT